MSAETTPDALQPLAATALARRCDPASIPFETTAAFDAPFSIVGQARAAEALAFGIGVAHEGYNVFVMGPAGSGKRTLVQDTLAGRAARIAPSSDWVLVNNFAAPHRPIAIELPAGRGAGFRRDMERLVEELRATIPAVFESEEYAHRVERIDAEFSERHEKTLAALGQDAARDGIALLRTPTGFTFAPLKDKEVIGAEDFNRLPETERQRIESAIAALQQRLEKFVRETLRWRNERNERVRRLNRDMMRPAVGQPVEDLAQRYADFAKVVEYLGAVERDVLEHGDDFRHQPEGGPVMLALASQGAPDRELRRYAVNVLVDRTGAAGAEVVFADHPTYANLVGRIEHVQHLGTLVTDFALVKPGALHRANGGYLVLDARAVLMQPFAWDALKRALVRREIRVEPLSELWGLATTVSLEPEPVPLAVKVVLLGERHLYYLLHALDPDFRRLFGVVADFDEAFDRTPESSQAMACAIAGLARHDALLPFDRGAVARTIDHAARIAADARKLTADIDALARLLREADFLARGAGRPVVTAADVEAAIAGQRTRAERLKQRVTEAIVRGTILIDTAGAKAGQVNGLSVIELGGFPFAEPVRITATTRVGEGSVIDIQREVELGGAIHSKGVMILSQFLAARFSGTRPHSLAASLAFEQTYGTVDGDSASLAELCALLSSLSGLPIRQSLAVTGSVNQLGEVQAIGAVNEKIEGFFDVCAARGLTGEQGVIIPAANLEHLMLRDDVVAAAAAGRFRVHAVRHADEAIELLTGVAAGDAALAAELAQDTVNARVAARLKAFAGARREQRIAVVRTAKRGRNGRR
jgi:lon-related putative ATP-dependent protease